MTINMYIYMSGNSWSGSKNNVNRDVGQGFILLCNEIWRMYVHAQLTSGVRLSNSDPPNVNALSCAWMTFAGHETCEVNWLGMKLPSLYATLHCQYISFSALCLILTHQHITPVHIRPFSFTTLRVYSAMLFWGWLFYSCLLARK